MLRSLHRCKIVTNLSSILLLKVQMTWMHVLALRYNTLHLSHCVLFILCRLVSYPRDSWEGQYQGIPTVEHLSHTCRVKKNKMEETAVLKDKYKLKRQKGILCSDTDVLLLRAPSMMNADRDGSPASLYEVGVRVCVLLERAIAVCCFARATPSVCELGHNPSWHDRQKLRFHQCSRP